MKTLTLEVSLKPFHGLDDTATLAACAEALRQWDTLGRRAEQISVLLWASDGSEILEYTGDLEAEMEWARFLGNANPHLHIPHDPEGRSLHARNYLYREDALPITYRRLGAVARAWREAAAATGRTIRVGLAFDPGGEFAPSEFKYKRHREICLSDTMGKASFVCCYGILNSDTQSYAGFPEGIPQGTSVGTFLGRQFRLLARDIGLDFLWLSNGFGFGMETWMTIGPLFDGRRFHPEKAAETRDRILGFWRDLRRELPPGIGVETRGTNLGTGTDLASDATPLRELYEGGFDFAPPPNSPWAAINGDFGIELAGYMSRVAELPPGRGMPFRYYLHDPWWLNSPWLDRYEGQPHDIYLPLGVGRVDASGHTAGASTLNLLTIDDSHGLMPDTVPTQATPHLLRAWARRPDAPGPLVWLYPFDEMHDSMFGDRPQPERLFHTDWFAREAINDGLPLNTVISTRAFHALGDRAKTVLAGRILVTPAPFDADAESHLLNWADSGGQLFVYGSLCHAPALRARLGLTAATPVAGTLAVQSPLEPLDRYKTGPARASRYEHRRIASGGDLTETPVADNNTGAVAIGEEGSRRALSARFSTPAGGLVCWLRAPLPLHIVKGTHLPVPDNRNETFPFTELIRQTLSAFGWHIGFHAVSSARRHPVLCVHRHDNGWFFSGYTPDTSVDLELRAPFGVPLFIGCEALLADHRAVYRMPRAWHHECRVFVEQAEGVVGCIERHPAQVGVTRRLLVSGLQDATLRFYPPPGAGPVTAWLNPQWPFISGDHIPLRLMETPGQGPALETATSVTGDVLLSW